MFDVSGITSVLKLLKCSVARDVLRTKAYTAEEKLVKTCFMQYLLLSVCLLNSKAFPGFDNDHLIPAWLSLLDVLISEGANPLGWSVRQVNIMDDAWEQLVDSGNFGKVTKWRKRRPFFRHYQNITVRLDIAGNQLAHRTCCGHCQELLRAHSKGRVMNHFSPPSVYPAVVRFITNDMRDNDPVAERLVQLANQRAPCVVQTLQQVRYACGYLHKSPRCTNMFTL